LIEITSLVPLFWHVTWWEIWKNQVMGHMLYMWCYVMNI